MGRSSNSLFKITKHKLFSTVTLVLAIIVKAVYSYRGNTVVSNTMDWLIGIPLTILLVSHKTWSFRSSDNVLGFIGLVSMKKSAQLSR